MIHLAKTVSLPGSARRWLALVDGSANGFYSQPRQALYFSIANYITRDVTVFGGPPKTARQRRALPR